VRRFARRGRRSVEDLELIVVNLRVLVVSEAILINAHVWGCNIKVMSVELVGRLQPIKG
jgi:hypothetical protein